MCLGSPEDSPPSSSSAAVPQQPCSPHPGHQALQFPAQTGPSAFPAGSSREFPQGMQSLGDSWGSGIPREGGTAGASPSPSGAPHSLPKAPRAHLNPSRNCALPSSELQSDTDTSQRLSQTAPAWQDLLIHPCNKGTRAPALNQLPWAATVTEQGRARRSQGRESRAQLLLAQPLRAQHSNAALSLQLGQQEAHLPRRGSTGWKTAQPRGILCFSVWLCVPGPASPTSAVLVSAGLAPELFWMAEPAR